jgi:hypothetical protein
VPISKSNASIDKLVYRYRDSGAPQYRESFEISATPRSIIRIEMRYEGNQRVEESLTSQEFADLVSVYEKAGYTALPLIDDDCNGGSSTSIFAYSGQDEVFGASVARCDENNGGLQGDPRLLLDAMQRFLPTMGATQEQPTESPATPSGPSISPAK